MSIRILATADIHIGRRPTRLANPDDAHRFSAARMWEAMVERAIEEKVDLVALAGDVVDHDNRFFEATDYHFASTDVATLGILHADLDVPDSPYAPVTRAELASTNVALWLLGHVHKPDFGEEVTRETLIRQGMLLLETLRAQEGQG